MKNRTVLILLGIYVYLGVLVWDCKASGEAGKAGYLRVTSEAHQYMRDPSDPTAVVHWVH